jgi:murein DD-endopeptidase MepM/ murein hydrolase activator NlpD
MQSKQNSKDSEGSFIQKKLLKMKISLSYKPLILMACLLYFSINPIKANAGFFSDLINTVVGGNETISSSTPSDEVILNSQTMPLLESSVNPDMKNIKYSPLASTREDDAISTDDLQGTDSDTASYISSSEKITTYTVKQGDTIGGIASKFGISSNTILYANTNIKNNVLKVGQVLIILPVDGISYTVKKGDTISSIAKIYKADANDISEYNNISDKNLKIGDKIIVPGATAVKKTEAVTTKTDIAVVKTAPASITTIDRTKENTKDTSSASGAISGGYIWPFPSGVGRVSQKLHDDNAYDFAAPKGTPIYAIQDGVVLIADASGYNGGYGLYVVVDFDDGGQAIFGHMSKVATYAGEVVKKGDVIGYVGSTGRSTGNHVHIGYRGGKANPYKNLPLNSRGL